MNARCRSQAALSQSRTQLAASVIPSITWSRTWWIWVSGLDMRNLLETTKPASADSGRAGGRVELGPGNVRLDGRQRGQQEVADLVGTDTTLHPDPDQVREGLVLGEVQQLPARDGSSPVATCRHAARAETGARNASAVVSASQVSARDADRRS